MKLKLKDYSITVLFLLISVTMLSQYKVKGVVSAPNNKPLNKVEIYDTKGGLLALTNNIGAYEFTTTKKQFVIYVYADNYELVEKQVSLKDAITTYNIKLALFSEQLSEIEIRAQRKKVFELGRLKDVVETAIYAGKKTEVVLLSDATVNVASNNARQIYSQIAGLNIFENDDAGLQLNIGGRGLDPNRTSNFNTRQNGYDISADVLGYPESYYSPPAEALDEIQVVRGAASLQYGTQFGGLVNFIFKKPNPNKELEIITRNTVGSNNLFTNFTSVSGTKNKWSYFAYYNYKRGDGFRPNSEFESKNAFAHIGYEFNEKSKLELEVTYLNYLAQQAGGLTDAMFNENPYQSNRERNWFKVDWLLYNLKFSHEFSDKTNFTFNFFGLNSSRKAIGFRTNRVNQGDPGGVRDLIIGDFNNFGFESRLLSKYQLFQKKSTFLIGTKFYKANNTSIQGPGSDGVDADFSIASDEFPNYTSQSNYKNPNLNIAFFAENILYLNDKLSVTPGIRLEYIKTESDGALRNIRTDAAGNVIFDGLEFSDESNERSFALLGVGLSYKLNDNIEFYGNVSQNYRSVTFSDLNLVNPSFLIDPNLIDEEGFTSDIGIRGNYKKKVSFDLGVFGLFYNNRIGLAPEVLANGSVTQIRSNVGDASILGIESLFDFNIKSIFNMNSNMSFNYFVNSSFITSEYTDSDVNGVLGNKVEFVPSVNIKTGLKFGYRNFNSSLQYTYLTEQFTDAFNSVNPSLSGVDGVIPSYSILDFSASYKYKFITLEAGVNNVLNQSYFTRRATGYPGPGIIPSAPRTFYTTLSFKI